MSTLYDVLGLQKTATSRMIRHAAEAALAESEAFADQEQARQRRSEVRAAWAVLGDKKRRLDYDRLLVAEVPHPDWSGGKPPPGFVAFGESVDPKIVKAIPTNRAWDAGSWILARQADSWRGVSLRAVQPDLSGLNDIAPGMLWALDISYQPVTDRGLAPVASHVGLIRLKMENTRVTDQGIAHLRGLSMLQELDLDGTAVGDGAAGVLAEMGSLRVLSLMQTGVTDAGVAALSSNKTLVELHLRGIKGISLSSLLCFQGVPSLRLLSAPRLPRRDRKELEAALAQCTVIH